MHAHQIYSCVLAVVLVASTCAAPLQEKQTKEKRDVAAELPPTHKVEDQEAQLENLVSLAGEKTKENNVAVHESHVSHFENTNGKEIKMEQTEEKVTDTKTGKVLADVKQVTETGSDENGKPQKVTETEVDIPDKDVHETFVKNDADNSEMVSDENTEAGPASVEFSPTAVAKYLLNSFDFDNFYAALKDLVSSSIMSEDEAERYEEQVIAEYQRLVAEQNEMDGNFMSDEGVQGYYPAYEEPEEKRSSMADQIPDNLYGLDGAYENYLGGDLDLGRQGLMEDSMPGEEDSLNNVIDALLNAWWEKDFEGGNERAMALVSYLDDVVSRDDNPDDIGQIRDILADMLANALLDDVQNAENEYKMEQAVDEAVSGQTEKAAAENTDSVIQEAEESSETPEEELNEVANVAQDTAEEKSETGTAPSDAKEELSVEDEEEPEKKSKEEKH